MGRGRVLNCKECNTPKTTDNCSVMKSGFFDSYCKKCKNERGKKHHEQNKEKRNAQIRDKYWEKRNQDPYFILKDDLKDRQVKICTICRQEKSTVLDEEGKCVDFYVEKNGRLGSRRKKCMDIYLAIWRKNNKHRKRKRLDKMKITQPEKYLFIRAKSRAKKKQIEFNLNIEDIKIPNTCPALGIQMMIGDDKCGSPSLDRIDNNKGYIRGNVIVVSYKANSLKRDSSLDERQKLVDFYSNIEESKKKIEGMELIEQTKQKLLYHNIKNNTERNIIRRTNYKNNTIEEMLLRAKARCRKSGLEFRLTTNDIILTKFCPIFNIEFDIASKNIENSPSLERIDSNKGYIPDNIIVISFKANRAKGNATLRDMIKINKFYKELNEKTASII